MREKLKLWKHSKIKMGQKSKTPSVTKLKTQNVTKQKKSKCNKTHNGREKTHKLKVWGEKIIKNATHFEQLKFYNSKCDKTPKLKMGQLKNQKIAKL